MFLSVSDSSALWTWREYVWTDSVICISSKVWYCFGKLKWYIWIEDDSCVSCWWRIDRLLYGDQVHQISVPIYFIWWTSHIDKCPSSINCSLRNIFQIGRCSAEKLKSGSSRLEDAVLPFKSFVEPSWRKDKKKGEYMRMIQNEPGFCTCFSFVDRIIF